jgi:hypothetical protein
MNLLAILKKIFPTQPTLQEFIEAANPVTNEDVEWLEKKYVDLYGPVV